MKQKHWDNIQLGDVVSHHLCPWTTFVVVTKDVVHGGWYVGRYTNHSGIMDSTRMATRKEWILRSRVKKRKHYKRNTNETK